MSWPRDPFVTDGGYSTPLPQQPCEAALWRAVICLYQYASIAALLKVNGPPAVGSGSAEADGTAAAVVSAPSPPAPPVTRADVVGRRSAFIAAADAASPLCTPSPSFSLSITSPSALPAAVSWTCPPTTSPPHSPNAPTVASLLTRSRSAGTWNDGGGGGGSGASLGGGSTTSFIRATCHRVLEPVHELLAQFDAEKLDVGASVVDVAVQHPLPCLRVELVRLLLTFRRWDWAMCAPVAVAAGVGDMDVLRCLLEVEELEPNLGFPLTVAVRRRQHERVLPCLVSHHRIKPNYGGAFYVAVATGNVDAMHILGSAIGVNVNRFANSEGSSALLYALRQYLRCSAVEAVAAQSVSVVADAATPSRQLRREPPPPPSHAIATPTSQLPSTAEEEEEEVTVTPLLSGRTARSHSRQGGRAIPRLPPAAAGGGGSKGDDGVSSGVAALGQRDNPLFGSVSALEDLGHGVGNEDGEAATSPRGCEPARSPTSADPLQTTKLWRGVLLYLLDHPAIEVNAGFYETPLQMAVFAGNVEVVAWLLQHPHLRPNRMPKSISVLRNSYYLLQRQVLCQEALQCVVSTPVEMAVQLRQLESFQLLVRDQRVQLPVRLTMSLERLAWDTAAIPYLTTLAQHRSDWEGWGWRWRRRCALVATAAHCVLAGCSWAVWWAWSDTLTACGWVLFSTYAVQVCVGVALFAWDNYCARAASSAAQRRRSQQQQQHQHQQQQQVAAIPAPVLAALIRHLVPTWSSGLQYAALLLLLLCPGAVPLLDLLCAWCLYRVHRSRRPLYSSTPQQQQQQRGGGPDGGGGGGASGSPPHTSRERIERARRRSMSSFSTSHRWAGMSAASSAAGNDSFAEAPPGAGARENESFSHPRPAAGRLRRTLMAVGGGGGGGSGSHPSPSVAAPGSADAATTAAAAAAESELLPRMSSSIATTSSPAGSPRVGSRRESWVVPGRPSRFTNKVEYHAPDLTLRALAYVVFDRLLVAPRLLLSVVGVFMFLYMVFPASPPTTAPASVVASANSTGITTGADASEVLVDTARTAAQSIFTVYYDTSSSRAAVMTGAVDDSGNAQLPRFTVMIGVVGFCGLIASIVSGGALLAMAMSLRTITSHSFFASPAEPGRGNGDGDGDGYVLRQVARGEEDRAARRGSDHIL